MIKLRNVSFGYKRNRPLYKNLNLTLSPGSIYGLLGPNGAGKSTLLRLLSGLLYPQAGKLQVGEYVPGDRQPAFLEDIFLVPEEFYLPPVRIRQFIGSNAPFYPRFDHTQMMRYIQEFGLTDDQKLNELSYGQKKKVLIGFGLATNTAVLLLDEPTNGLDIPSKSQFRRLVASAADEHRTVVISTHQVRDLETLIDPIVVLSDQVIALNASVEEITARLWFGMVSELDNSRPILYSERAVGGYALVAENPMGEPSRLDLERLFNAVQAEPARIQKLFSATSILANP
ncbi:ATP-binding cassette domain-containing protein [Spirosoma sp. HMF3257]|uniref:ABC transporter ATP-binding protein n=1 Tax=Spirosoma telluris TaxID=2183553 RepID=A0A327NK24_9BACT|nr:ATP-binding cassette domain-containing protein [Spirosoma telluris]RAI74396.1 ABC transporter ATP-binding protein [Spirosoma telluris]